MQQPKLISSACSVYTNHIFTNIMSACCR